MAQTVAVVRHTSVLDGEQERYAAWRGRLLAAIHESPGFLSLEIRPPNAAQPDWITIERFTSSESMQLWLESPERLSLLDGIDDLVAGPDSITFVTENDRAALPGVTAVINHRVIPGKERDFLDWQLRIHALQATYEGYLDVNVQPPMEGISKDWVTLLRFDSADNLRAWLDSPRCLQLAEESKPFLDKADLRFAATSFRNWLPEEERAADPSLWKVNAIVLLVLYPVVVLTLVFINPLFPGLGLAPMTFIDNVIGVAVTGFILVPLAARALGRWLSPLGPRTRQISIWGWVGMGVAYAVLIALMTAIANNFS